MVEARTHTPSPNLWLMQAQARLIFLFPRLVREVKFLRREVEAYVAQHHPDATAMEKDAMRHAFISAKLTERYGQDYTLFLGYWNEAARDLKGNNPAGDRGMDLFNNKAASDFARTHPRLDDKTLLDALWAKTQDGSLITSMQDARAVTRRYTDDRHIAGNFFRRLQHAAETLYGTPTRQVMQATPQQRVLPASPTVAV